MKFISFCFKTFSPAIQSFLVITGLSISLASCQWGDEVTSLVQPNPDDFLALYSDSMTVSLSTIGEDSIMTGAASRLFVGRFADPYLGKMHSIPFFQPTLDGSLNLADAAVYDSLILSLRYDGYYYGDTTKMMNLTVHALQEDMLLKNAYYNDDSTPYNAEPIGKISFLPNPRPRVDVTKKIVQIKLSAALGQKVFNMAKTNLLPSNTEWINVLKGIVVIPGISDNGAVVGFSRDSSSLQLHYHTSEVEGVVRDSSIFKVTASYNQVIGDKSKTVLAKLPERRISLPSSQSGELTFIQAGAGIMTRVDLPTIRQLRDIKYSYANRAYLIVTPAQQSNAEPFRAPTTIYAYYCDKNNQYYSNGSGLPLAITDLGGGVVTGTLINDMLNNKQYYRLDISKYVSDILSNESDDSPGLLLRSSPFSSNASFPELNTEFSKSFTRLVIGSQNNPTDRGVKLELYYTTAKAL